MVSDATVTPVEPDACQPLLHDSAKPCRAWARSPTMVRLRDGQRRSSICHSASVSSCASSTTTWANGPGQQVGVGRRQRRVVDERRLQVVAAQHRHQPSPSSAPVSRSRCVVDRPRPSARARAASAASRAPSPPRRLRVAEPQPGRVEQRQVGDRPRLGVVALQRRGPPRARARARTGAGRPAPSRGRRRGRCARSAARPGRRRRAAPALRSSDAPELVGGAGPRRRLAALSTRIVRTSSQTSSRARLWGVPGSGESKASAHSDAVIQTSPQGGLDHYASVGGSS